MEHIKKFEEFIYNAEPGTAPAPTKKPAPTTTPGQSPSRKGRPSPIRRDKPGVEPAPKAKKATEQDVIDRFTELTNQN